MKRVLYLLLILLLLAGCGPVKNQNTVLNERFLSSLDSLDNYDRKNVEAREEKTETGTTGWDRNIYGVYGYDDKNRVVRYSIYYAPEDLLIRDIHYYYKNSDINYYKAVLEYNRDFYDHMEDYDLSPEFYGNNEVKYVIYQGEVNQLGKMPFIEHYYYPDGQYGKREVLLNESGGEDVHAESYDADGNLLSERIETADGLIRTSLIQEYEDGVLKEKWFYDYVQGFCENTEYKNGEVIEEKSWKIDEHGNYVE
ncbi:MAG: hypothetical protein IIZ33_06270 [Erysipelotrichaceae bacterium]|nr:hypothetical protein [Erysipelotrichaceae bacterium]